jgi:hypothetical protein
MKNMKLTFQWVFACVNQVNMGSSGNVRRGFENVSHLFPQMHEGLLLKKGTG